MIDMGTLLHTVVDYLLWPVVASLLLLAVFVVLEVGTVIGERLGGIRRICAAGPDRLEMIARKRIGRVDIIARLGPTLGLMGTLIPLGPGIAAMGQGDFATLAAAVNTAFDTTVLGLFVGAVAFLIGRWRRTAYDAALTALETNHA